MGHVADRKESRRCSYQLCLPCFKAGGGRICNQAVGDDELGNEILKELDNNSIRYLIEKVPYPTGTVQVTLQNGVPDYIINERVAWDHLSPTSNAIDLAERADAICFGTLGQRSTQSRETIPLF